jgi:hypothetical protein
MPLSRLLVISISLCSATVMAGENAKCDVTDLVKNSDGLKEIKDPQFPEERIVREVRHIIGGELLAHPIYYYVLIYPESGLAFINKGGGIAEISVWLGPIRIDPNSYESCQVSEVHKAVYDQKHGN